MGALAKISIPNSGKIFLRKRLFRRLDEALSRPVVFITGPAGSGKTSLVTSYLKDRGVPCLWYQMDERDADAASFFYLMGLAARKAAPRYRKQLPLFTPEYGLGVPTFARSYFENLCARLKPPCVLVFDNYQEIPADSPLHEIIRTGLSTFPENISSVIISRSDPPGAFAAMHAGNNLRVIDWKDLRLTPGESKGIARLQEIGRPNSGMYEWLHEKSDGWAAGLVLLARAVKSHGMDPAALNGVAPEKVFDYFANELFTRLDEPLQDFLLKTAFVPKLTPGLAERLTGNETSGEILSNLNQRNYFTEKRVQPEVTYQYHSLFREFLTSHAARRFTSGQLSDVQSRAAKLLEASGQVEDAAELFVQAGASKELTALIHANARTIISEGRNRLLENWITALPEELLGADPWANFWLGSCRLGSNPVESRELLERAFELFVTSGDETGAFLAWSGAVQTYLYIFDDFSPLDRWIAWLDERGGADAVFPSPEIALTVAAGMTAALTWRNPAHPDMRSWVDKTLSLSKDCSDIQTLTRAYANCAVGYIWKGMFGECRMLIDEMKRMIASEPVSPLMSLVINLTEAMYYNTSAEPGRQALKSVNEGLEKAQKTGMHVIDSLLYKQGVIASLSEGNPGRAGEFLSKLEKTLRYGGRTHAAHYHYLSACRYLMTGKASRAVLSARESLGLVREVGVPFSEFLARLALSHALHQAGDGEEADRELVSAGQAVKRTGSFYFEYLYWLSDAGFKYSEGENSAGRKSLRKAMALGRRRAFKTHLSFWRPKVMSRLCGKALEAGIETEYVQDLIRKLNLVPDEQSMNNETWPWPVKIYLLGKFQMFIDGEPVQFTGKVQKKPLLLLKALVVLGGGEARPGQIEDVLWPDSEGHVARYSLDTTLHRLRKWIGHPEAFHFSSGLAEMDRTKCWTDVWAFEGLVEGASAEERQGRADRTVELTERAMSLYKGALLPREWDEHWAVSPRERLRRKFLRCVTWLGRRHEEAEEWEKAAACYDRGLEVDDVWEEFYQRMMFCYQRLGRTADALNTYERCRKVLSAVLGVKPSAGTEKLRKSLR